MIICTEENYMNIMNSYSIPSVIFSKSNTIFLDIYLEI